MKGCIFSQIPQQYSSFLRSGNLYSNTKKKNEQKNDIKRKFILELKMSVEGGTKYNTSTSLTTTVPLPGLITLQVGTPSHTKVFKGGLPPPRSVNVST